MWGIITQCLMRIWFYVAKTIISLLLSYTRPFIQSKLRWKIESFYEIYKLFSQLRHQIGIGWLVGLMVFNVTFNNISVISWRSVLLVEETGGPGKNHRPVASHWQALSHNVVHLALIGIQLTTSELANMSKSHVIANCSSW